MSDRENLRRSSRLQARVQEEKVLSVYDENNGSSDDEFDKYINKTLEDIEEDPEKPVVLFNEDIVSGKSLYGFQTPSKSNAMTEKANKCRTPIRKKAPMSLLNVKVVLERLDFDCQNSPNRSNKTCVSKTSSPVTRKRLPPAFSMSENESVTDSSDYMPSQDDSEDTSSENQDSDASNDENNEIGTKIIAPKYVAPSKLLSTPKRIGGRNKPAILYKDFLMKADDYFETQSEKVVTSDRTLERLRNSRLTKEKLEELLASQNHVSNRHQRKIFSMSENYMALFPMWYFIMEEGYTVLLHGLGSKRCLINHFHKSIADYPSLVVNGFFPSLTIKDILEGIIVDILGLNSPVNTSECTDLIEKVLKDNPKDRLYLLIHNIDGIMLRSNKAQDVLSCLASIPNLCVLASVDHINTPLLWDHVKRSKFNFFWWDATTFLPYEEETSYESSLMVQKSGTLALSSLHNVFLSLTSNAKSIYILVAKYQLKNGNSNNFNGMAFKDLYRAAREGFLVSSDLALRAQLTEFIDHKLVKTKRNIDGVENLVIPFGDALLKQFLEEHEL